MESRSVSMRAMSPRRPCAKLTWIRASTPGKSGIGTAIRRWGHARGPRRNRPGADPAPPGQQTLHPVVRTARGILNRKLPLSRPKTETGLMTRSHTRSHENGSSPLILGAPAGARRRGRDPVWCHRARERAWPRPRFRTHTCRPRVAGSTQRNLYPGRRRLVPRAGREPSQPHRRADLSTPSSPPRGGRRPEGGPTGGARARSGRGGLPEFSEKHAGGRVCLADRVARFGRIDRSSQGRRCARRCRRTDARQL